MINPMKMISAMQELMDKHGYRYPFAIKYEEGNSPTDIDADIQPVRTNDCKYPLEIWPDNDK